MKRFQKIISLVALSLSLSLISPDIIPALTPIETVEAATVKLNKSKSTLLKGQTLTLKLYGTKKKAKWTSSNSKIASVNSKGKVTGKSKGNVTITAKIGKKSYKCKVTVESPKLNKTSYTLKSGKTFQLKLNGTKQKIKWSSSNKSVATVNSKGKITAKKAGKCYIYASVGNMKYKCKITVKSSETSSESSYVWLSVSGTKYHKIPNCGRMNPDKARKVTKQQAIDEGFTACDKCF